jgi:hypothetical protein
MAVTDGVDALARHGRRRRDELLYRAQLGSSRRPGRGLGWVELHAAGALGQSNRAWHQLGGVVGDGHRQGLHAELGADDTTRRLGDD